MGESIISRHGGQQSSLEEYEKYKDFNAIVLSNTTFVVPIDGTYHINCIGGGGGGGFSQTDGTTRYACCLGGGGGSGYFKTADIKLKKYQAISITIGSGGAAGTQQTSHGGTGGTTSFGTYLSAAGGQGGFRPAAESGGYVLYTGGNGGNGGVNGKNGFKGSDIANGHTLGGILPMVKDLTSGINYYIGSGGGSQGNYSNRNYVGFAGESGGIIINRTGVL